MISVVIPLHNEEKNLPLLAEKLETVLGDLKQDYEVILVNDGSTDGTREKIKALAAGNRHFKGLHFRRNFGQTAAMMAGFRHAEGEIIVAMDGDLQNDPADIPRLLTKLDEGYDVVSGWRKDREDAPLRRNLPSHLANWLISALSGVQLHDYGCSLKAYRRDILASVNLYGEMHRFIPIYAYWGGGRIAEIPVSHHPRLHGASNYGLERVTKVVLDLMVVLFLHRYAQKPMHVFGLCGLASLGFSLLSSLAAIYFKIWGGKSFIQTPLPLITAVLFFTGVLCFLLGLLAELSIRIYYESQDKPTYVIAAADNLDLPPAHHRSRIPFSFS
jgi:glycosyltransferase involved in cell wall biosynthesis